MQKEMETKFQTYYATTVTAFEKGGAKSTFGKVEQNITFLLRS